RLRVHLDIHSFPTRRSSDLAEEHSLFIPNLFGTVLDVLDSEFDCFDLKDSSNFGLDSNHKLTFIDYGMTRRLYEERWVPLAEEGDRKSTRLNSSHVSISYAV